MVGRGGCALFLALVTVALVAGPAEAATRFAAPDGPGTAPCEDRFDPCPLYVAAEKGWVPTENDVVELEPGVYSETAGDFGPAGFVQLRGGTVRGEPGKARPLLRVEVNDWTWGAFFVHPDAAISHLEIENVAYESAAFTVQDGRVEDVIARSLVSDRITCNFFSGVLRNSVCLNLANGVALGTNVRPFEASTTTIRNSTAIATGEGAVGASFSYHAGGPGIVSSIEAKGLIARGDHKDIVASGLEYCCGYGATTNVSLDHSDYATVETETSGPGGASITPPGTNGNILAAPTLAADGFHQLPGSPTVNSGAIDDVSSATDIDGGARVIGPAPDIGADELEEPTGLPVSGGDFPGEAVAGDRAASPGTWLRTHPSKRTTKRLAKFTFGSDVPGSHFECKLDYKRFRGCSPPFRRKVSRASHIFRVRAVNPQGISDPTPAIFHWRVVSR